MRSSTWPRMCACICATSSSLRTSSSTSLMRSSSVGASSTACSSSPVALVMLAENHASEEGWLGEKRSTYSFISSL